MILPTFVFVMEGLPMVAFNDHLAPLLDGRDAARLRRVSRTCKDLVDNSRYLTRRRKQHYIWLDEPECIKDETAEDIEFVSWVPYQTFAYLLKRNPPVEGITEIKSSAKRQRWLMTNHYESHSNYNDSIWDVVPRNVKLLQYRPLGGNQRHALANHLSTHRGGCVLMEIEYE